MQKRELEERIRDSSSYLPEELLGFYLEYARMVRDEEAVYEYMELNSIGTGQPDYWLARLSLLSEQCQYVQVALMLKRVRDNPALNLHYRLHLIDRFEEELITTIKSLYRSKNHGKRSAKQYEAFSLDSPSKINQKIGDIDLYVNSPNRMNYELQDYANSIEQKFPERKQLEKKRIEKKNLQKQLSFVSQGLQRHNEIASSLNENEKLRNDNESSFKAGKALLVAIDRENTTPPKNRESGYSSYQNLDSVEIIERKKIWKRSLSPHFQTPTGSSNPEQRSLQKKEVARNDPPKPNFNQFSFGRRAEPVNQSFSAESGVFANVNAARIEEQNLTGFKLRQGEDSFILGLVLQECQQEKYEPESLPSFETNSNEIESDKIVVLSNRKMQPHEDIDASIASLEISDLLSLTKPQIENILPQNEETGTLQSDKQAGS